MGIVTTSSETAFRQPPEEIYDFVTNPANWPKTYPGSMHIEGLPDYLPLKVGDTWREGAPTGKLYTWQLAIATRPRLWMFTSVGLLGHDAEGQGGFEARMTIQYEFLRPGLDVTLFRRTMTVEAYKDVPRDDDWFRVVNPAHIDRYHAAIARELEKASSGAA